MYHDKSKFKVLDTDYDIVQVIVGYDRLIEVAIYGVMTGQVGTHFNEYTLPYGDSLFKIPMEKPELIIVDDEGRSIPAQRIWEEAGRPTLEEYQRKNWAKRKKRYLPKGVKFRRDPVPGTGGYTKCNFYRHIRFLQEWKASVEDQEYIRPKRRRGILGYEYYIQWYEFPTRGDYYIKKSWKKQKKKKQWM